MQHRPRNVYHLSAVAGRFTRLGMICGVNTRMEAGRRPRGEKDGERGGWKRALWRPSSHDSLHDPVCRACCQARNACSRLRICSRKLAYRSFFVKLFPRFLLRFSDINILEIIYYRDKRRLKPKEQFSSKFFHLFQESYLPKIQKLVYIFNLWIFSLCIYIRKDWSWSWSGKWSLWIGMYSNLIGDWTRRRRRSFRRALWISCRGNWS